MQVEDRLPCIWTTVDDQAVSTFGNAVFVSQFLCNGKHVPNQGFILGGQVVYGGDVLAWHDQDMNRCSWMDVQEGYHLLILVNGRTGDIAFNDLTENAVWIHESIPKELRFHRADHRFRFRLCGQE